MNLLARPLVCGLFAGPTSILMPNSRSFALKFVEFNSPPQLVWIIAGVLPVLLIILRRYDRIFVLDSLFCCMRYIWLNLEKLLMITSTYLNLVLLGGEICSKSICKVLNG